jgi:DNA-binding response OmpR family regulator
LLRQTRDQVVHRDELLREVWGHLDTENTTRSDQLIFRLRQKIEPNPHRPVFIRTAHGDGYCLSVADQINSK